VTAYSTAVSAAIETLAADPSRGKPSRGRLRHLRSLRVGVYRVVYRFDSRRDLLIVETIRHRSEAYR